MRQRLSGFLSYIFTFVSRKSKFIVYFVLVILAEAWSVVEWHLNPPKALDSLIFAIIHVVAIFSILLNAKVGSFVLIIASILFSFSQNPDSGPSEIWGVLIALGIAAYEFRVAVSILLLTSLIVCQAIVTFKSYGLQYGYVTLASFASVFIVSYLFGKSISWKNLIHKTEEEANLLYLKEAGDARRRRIAIIIHDGMSGSLSLATRELQRLMRTGSNEVDRNDLQKVNNYIVEALKGMKFALDCLDNDVDFPDVNNIDDLKLLIKDEDARLKQLGYKGTWDCVGTCIFNSFIGYVAASFVHECCANILKHSLAGCVYHISVSVGCNNIQIVCSNNMDMVRSDKTQYASDNINSGYGLSLQKANISSIGGSCAYGVYNDEWKAIASIPLRI